MQNRRDSHISNENYHLHEIQRLVLLICVFIGSLHGTTGWAVSAPSSNTGRCMTCHSAPTADIHIDSDRFSASVHGKLSCTDCHQDLRGASLPHPHTLKKVNCNSCHSTRNIGMRGGAPKAYVDSAHGKALAKHDPDAPDCARCHGNHTILAPSNPESQVSRSNILKLCEGCHARPDFARRHKLIKGNIIQFSSSVHGKASAKGNTAAAICTDCHGVHNIRVGSDPRSSVARPHIPETCGACHQPILAEYRQGIHGHANKNGVKEAPVCTDCHGEHNIRAPGERGSTVGHIGIVKTCARCHENVKLAERYHIPASRLTTYLQSYHGIANQYGDVTVADCASCHGAHMILPSSDPRSSINKKNLPTTCGKCHPGASKNFSQGTIHLMPTTKQDPLIFWIQFIYRIFVALVVASFIGYVILDVIARIRTKGKMHG